MPTCYIFTRYLREDGCLMLRLNDEGMEELAPQHYPFETLQKLQDGCKTMLVCPSTEASIFQVELPWVADKKARAALPFALEDKLSQPIDILHFAFDRQRYQNGQYEVAVLEKQMLKNLMDIFSSHDIEFNQITLDWYALNPDELACTEDTLLVSTDQFKGALAPELTSAFQSIFNTCQAYAFSDSKLTLNLPHLQVLAEPAASWIAKRLHAKGFLNLCQGDLQHGTSTEKIKKGYQLVGIVAAAWLAILIGVEGVKLYMVNQNLKQVDQEIALIYKKFFPEATQVISPKFRITQLLNNNQTQSHLVFWNLVKKFAQGLKQHPGIVEQLRFNNATLLVTMAFPDFAKLEQLENTLRDLKLNVTQTQAANRGQQVVATLELK